MESSVQNISRDRRLSAESWMYLGVMLLALLKILWAPVFVTQDGPLHSFYSQVFASLLHGDRLYAAAYAIRSIFPPYSAHLYLLIFINKLTGDVFVTERIIAALAVACTFVGFARLCWALNKQNLAPIGMCLPFVANWTLFMGFSNFTFGLAILMLATGYWIDHAAEFHWREACISAVLSFLLSAMHPVALSLFFVVAGLHLLSSLLALRRDATRTFLSTALRLYGPPSLFLICAALVNYFWVRGYVDRTAMRLPVPNAKDIAERIGSFLSLNEISPFSFSIVYTTSLLCVFVPCAVFAFYGVRSRWKEPRVATIAVMTLFCFFVYLVIPKEINTAFHVHRRFSVFAVFLILALAASWYGSMRAWRRMAWIATAAGLVVIVMQYRANIVSLHDIRPALDAPPLRPGSRVVELRFGLYRYGTPLRYAPGMWAVAYWCSSSHAVLMNMPWATQPYYPIRAKHDQEIDPEDLAPPYLKAISQHASLPLDPDAIVIEMSVTHQGEQNSAIYALEHQYGFRQLPETSPDLTLMIRGE